MGLQAFSCGRGLFGVLVIWAKQHIFKGFVGFQGEFPFRMALTGTHRKSSPILRAHPNFGNTQCTRAPRKHVSESGRGKKPADLPLKPTNPLNQASSNHQKADCHLLHISSAITKAGNPQNRGVPFGFPVKQPETGTHATLTKAQLHTKSAAGPSPKMARARPLDLIFLNSSQSARTTFMNLSNLRALWTP